MPYRKEVFENNRFYHVIIRGFNGKILFSKERDCLRFLLSAHLINHIPPNIELKLSRWDNSQMAKLLSETDIPKEFSRRPRPLVSISTFSLMKNHAHFLLKQVLSGGIQEFAQRLQNSFAKFFNIKYKNRGPVFEKNFRAVPIIDDRQFRYVVGYITLNTLDTVGMEWRRVNLKESWSKAKKVLDSYPWSSYHYFMGENDFSTVIEGDLVKELFPTPKKFEKHLKDWRADEIINI